MPKTQQPPAYRLPPAALDQHIHAAIKRIQAFYVEGHDRVITPENTYQPAQREGRKELEALQDLLLLPGSGVFGLEHFAHCRERLCAGESVIWLPEHRGNLDVSSFHVLLRRAVPDCEEILERLVYIAGRKLNESSEYIKMFTEKYTRLVVVPPRDLPQPHAAETPAERQQREEFITQAQRINRSAFRQMKRLSKQGAILVLFPLGGRWKPGASTRPLRETTAYIQHFDWVYPLSMEGNTLPPRERMEEEWPVPDRVAFRFGEPLETHVFLREQRARYEQEQASGQLPAQPDFEQFVADQIMTMLETLRNTHGNPHEGN